MRKRRLRAPSPAFVISLIALFVALGGTTYATTSLPKNSVGTKQLKNGAVTKTKINKKTITALKGNRGQQGPQGIQGIRGIQGIQGIRGVKGDTGAAGTARAYGRVVGTAVTRSKNVVSVTNPGAGTFCITLAAGIDATTTGVVVSPDFFGDATLFNTNADQAFAEWNSSNSFGCPAGTLEVETGFRTVSTSGSTDGDIRTVTNDHANQGFFFIVP